MGAYGDGGNGGGYGKGGYGDGGEGGENSDDGDDAAAEIKRKATDTRSFFAANLEASTNAAAFYAGDENGEEDIQDVRSKFFSYDPKRSEKRRKANAKKKRRPQTVDSVTRKYKQRQKRRWDMCMYFASKSSRFATSRRLARKSPPPVLHAAVDNMRSRDPCRERLYAALHLGDHAPLDRTFRDELAALLNGEFADQLSAGVENTLDVGQQDELFRAERSSEG